MDRWFYTCGIPTRIHSNQDKSFENKIIEQLCKIHGVAQSTSTPYNPHGNSPCEQFNCTLQNLKFLLKRQKPNGPICLSTLVLAYKITPQSTTGYLLYQLTFGHKALTPCDIWLGLAQYNNSECIQRFMDSTTL